MSQVRISNNVRGIELDIDSVFPTEGDILYAMQRLRTRILERTAKGVDVEGRPFAPYSKKYAKKRDKSGRNVTPVDLTWSGRMRNSIQIAADTLRFPPGTSEERIGPRDFKQRASEGRVGIYDPENAAKASGMQGDERAKGMPERRFLASSDADNIEVAEDIRDRMLVRIHARK